MAYRLIEDIGLYWNRNDGIFVVRPRYLPSASSQGLFVFSHGEHRNKRIQYRDPGERNEAEHLDDE